MASPDAAAPDATRSFRNPRNQLPGALLLFVAVQAGTTTGLAVLALDPLSAVAAGVGGGLVTLAALWFAWRVLRRGVRVGPDGVVQLGVLTDRRWPLPAVRGVTAAGGPGGSTAWLVLTDGRRVPLRGLDSVQGHGALVDDGAPVGTVGEVARHLDRLRARP